MKRFFAVFNARNIEFIKDKSSLVSTILMPLVLIVGFSIIFSSDNKSIYKVGVIGSDETPIEFFSTRHIKTIPFENKKNALNKLKHHQVDMVIKLDGENIYWVNSSSPDSYLLARILKGSGGGSFQRQLIEGEEIDYIDWLLPGILSFNIMFGCLFGVGFTIVRYRKSGYLRRLKATPLLPIEFLLAQMTSRLLLMLGVTAIILLVSTLIINFTMHGSYLLLFAVFFIGSICMISLSLIVAARVTAEELAGGLLNLSILPMMLLSGVWFSLEGSHPIIQYFSQILPLTHIVDAARAVMTEGANLADISNSLFILIGMSLIFLLIGTRIFRWE